MTQTMMTGAQHDRVSSCIRLLRVDTDRDGCLERSEALDEIGPGILEVEPSGKRRRGLKPDPVQDHHRVKVLASVDDWLLWAEHEGYRKHAA